VKNKLIPALKLLFFLGLGCLFIWLFLKDLLPEEKQEIANSFEHANYLWVIIAIILAFLSHVMRTLRWQMLIRPLGYKTRFPNVFMSLMIGYLANLALPRLGEITRCTVLAKYEKVPFQKGFGTVVAERAFDLLTFLVLFFINFLIQYDRLQHYVSEKIYTPLAAKFSFIGQGYLLYLFIGGMIVCIILFFLFRRRLGRYSLYRKIANIIKGFGDGLKSLVRIQNPLLFLTYTVLMWIMYFLMGYLCFFSIEQTSGLTPMAGFSVLVLGTIAIMVVQGGIGIYPAVVAGTLVLYAGEAIKTYSYALGWLIWTSQTVILILAGIASLIVLPLINKSRNG
jgi:glycosyltransferase 2 family protein